jgi:hypothetical protein
MNNNTITYLLRPSLWGIKALKKRAPQTRQPWSCKRPHRQRWGLHFFMPHQESEQQSRNSHITRYLKCVPVRIFNPRKQKRAQPPKCVPVLILIPGKPQIAKAREAINVIDRDALTTTSMMGQSFLVVILWGAMTTKDKCDGRSNRLPRNNQKFMLLFARCDKPYHAILDQWRKYAEVKHSEYGMQHVRFWGQVTLYTLSGNNKLH